MALNTPSNLKLGQLGHIAGGNANSTSQTSLASTCRGSASGTSMWATFRIGSTAVLVNRTGVNGLQGKGNFNIRVRNDVGEYMGGTSSGEWINSDVINDINDNTDSSDTYYMVHVEETLDGPLYEEKIAQRSTNAADYESAYVPIQGSAGFAIIQQTTDKDKFKFWNP